jgi:hypothetical protein
MKEYWDIMQEADPETDGGGKLSPDDFIDNGDGTVTTTRTIKDGDREVSVVYTIDETGQLVGSPEVDDDEIDDEWIDKAEDKIINVGKTAGQTYRDRQLQKQAITRAQQLEQQLADEKAQRIKLEQQLADARKGSQRMTDADAKEYFGVDSVAQVKEQMEDDYALYVVNMARFSARYATPQKAEKTEQPARPTVAKPVRKAPTTVPDGGGDNKPKTKPDKDPFGYIKKYMNNGVKE